MVSLDSIYRIVGLIKSSLRVPRVQGVLFRGDPVNSLTLVRTLNSKMKNKKPCLKKVFWILTIFILTRCPKLLE